MIGCAFWSTTGLPFRWGVNGLACMNTGPEEVKIPVLPSPAPKCNPEGPGAGLSPVMKAALAWQSEPLALDPDSAGQIQGSCLAVGLWAGCFTSPKPIPTRWTHSARCVEMVAQARAQEMARRRGLVLVSAHGRPAALCLDHSNQMTWPCLGTPGEPSSCPARPRQLGGLGYITGPL